jgi:hypothetical protein
VIQDRSKELAAFCAKHFTKTPERSQARTNGRYAELSDEEVIALAAGARNSAKFEALWAGDTSGYASPSEADQALVSFLAFYTQDEGQLDSLYRSSGLCREKWINRPDYRRRTIQRALSNLSDIYRPSDDGARMVVSDGHASLPSPSPSPYKEEGRGRKPEAVRFSEMKLPGPRRYLLKDLVLAAYVTLLYGDGGVAKSLLALALAVGVSGGSKKWLGRGVENCPVLYVDFELDGEEQARRVHQLCRGQGLDTPPDNLLYMSALGHTAKEAFAAALEACKEHGVGLMVVDSLGPALQGDAEAARDVIGFFQKSIEPFRAEDVAVLIIDNRPPEQAAGRTELPEQGSLRQRLQDQPRPQRDTGTGYRARRGHTHRALEAEEAQLRSPGRAVRGEALLHRGSRGFGGRRTRRLGAGRRGHAQRPGPREACPGERAGLPVGDSRAHRPRRKDGQERAHRAQEARSRGAHRRDRKPHGAGPAFRPCVPIPI